MAVSAGDVGAAAPPAHAEPSAQLEKSRQEFIQNFKRINLNTTPGDAAFLRIVVEAARAKSGLEIGTATGYGAIHMGLAFERNGGHLTTVDIDPKMVQTARENLKQAALDRTVTVVEGDALQVIPKLEGRFDFVFIDAVKKDYLKYLRAVEPKLEPGTVIVADNVIRSADAMADFLDALRSDPKYRMTILRASDEKKDGMALIYKLK